jgi:hypothetical protein
MLSNLPPGVSENDPHINPPDEETEMKTEQEIRDRIKFLHNLAYFGGSEKAIQSEIAILQWVLGENQ